MTTVLFRLDLDCVRNITFGRVCSCDTGYECICNSVVVMGVLREGTYSCTPPPQNTEHYWGTALRKLRYSPRISINVKLESRLMEDLQKAKTTSEEDSLISSSASAGAAPSSLVPVSKESVEVSDVVFAFCKIFH